MKRILALLLCFVMIFGLAACGDKTGEPQVEEKPSQEETKPDKEVNISKDPVDLPGWMGESGETEPKDEVEEPKPGDEFPQVIDAIMFGNKTYELSAINAKTLKELGFEPKSGISMWMTFSDFMSLSGSGYEHENGQEIVVCTLEDDTTKIIGLVVDNAETDCVFYKGIKIGMSESDCMSIIGDMESDSTESFGTKKYAVHNKENSLVVSIEDGAVVEIIVCVSKEARLNLSESSETEVKLQDYLDYNYPLNDHTQWFGYGFVSNSALNLKDLEIDGQKFSIDEMTVDHIVAMGFKPVQQHTMVSVTDNKALSYNITTELFESDDGRTIRCVFNEDRKIEFLHVEKAEDEGEKQVNIKLIKDVMINSEYKTVEKVFKDSQSTWVGGSTYLIKSEDVTLLICVDDSQTVSDIMIINNKLVW